VDRAGLAGFAGGSAPLDRSLSRWAALRHQAAVGHGGRFGYGFTRSSGRQPWQGHAVRPPSFHAELRDDWSLWVIENGLPKPPASELRTGESVPVACWVGPRTAAVAHVERSKETWDDEPRTDALVDLFYRVDDSWMRAGHGGSDWREESPLFPVDVPPARVDLATVSTGAGCLALSGEVGSAAAVVEVIQGDEVTRRPIEAPAGLLVVCGDSTQPLAVRILDVGGSVLCEIDAHAAWKAVWDSLPRPTEWPSPSLPPPPVPPRAGHGTVFVNGDGGRWSASWQDESGHADGPDGSWERVSAWARHQPAQTRLVFSAEANDYVDLDTLDEPRSGT
jgi:hypothetical protein